MEFLSFLVRSLNSPAPVGVALLQDQRESGSKISSPPIGERAARLKERRL
jgi:hypothetical protein